MEKNDDGPAPPMKKLKTGSANQVGCGNEGVTNTRATVDRILLSGFGGFRDISGNTQMYMARAAIYNGGESSLAEVSYTGIGAHGFVC